uniref:Obg-like ATPase 1 n=1 Tax=Ciona savignyi TaxID=51511 RepID=H2Z0M3_CIOSA
MTRAFDDAEVVHIEGDVNPVRDLEIIQEELRLKDVERLVKRLAELEKVYTRGGEKKYKLEFETLTKIKMLLVDEKRPVRDGEWGSKEIDVLNDHLFLTSKPQIYLVNLSEKDYVRKKNKWLMKIKTWVQEHDSSAILIPFSGAFELKLSELGEDGERESYLKEEYKDAVSSALNKIIVTGFKALGLEYFFTAGVDEVKAWTIKKGTLAPQAAGRIHSDFEKGFIMAEVQKFADFKELGSETAVKAAGKYRQQGRNYIVEDGDIIFFKFNTPSQPKKK